MAAMAKDAAYLAGAAAAAAVTYESATGHTASENKEVTEKMIGQPPAGQEARFKWFVHSGDSAHYTFPDNVKKHLDKHAAIWHAKRHDVHPEGLHIWWHYIRFNVEHSEPWIQRNWPPGHGRVDPYPAHGHDDTVNIAELHNMEPTAEEIRVHGVDMRIERERQRHEERKARALEVAADAPAEELIANDDFDADDAPIFPYDSDADDDVAVEHGPDAGSEWNVRHPTREHTWDEDDD